LLPFFSEDKPRRFPVHDAQKTGVAKVLRASSAIEDFAVQKHADIVAVADIELLYLVAVGMMVVRAYTTCIPG